MLQQRKVWHSNKPIDENWRGPSKILRIKNKNRNDQIITMALSTGRMVFNIVTLRVTMLVPVLQYELPCYVRLQILKLAIKADGCVGLR